MELSYSLLNNIRKIRKNLDAFLMAVMILLFAAMFCVTNLHVFSRYLFNKPIIISAEMARYAYCDLIFLGSIYTMREDGHIGVDFFTERMPKVWNFFFTQAGRILTLVFLFVFTYQSWVMTKNSAGTLSTAMQIPMALPYLPMVVGGLGMIIEEAILIKVRWCEFRATTKVTRETEENAS